MMPMDPETERVRVIYDRRGLTMAPGDRSFLFGDARAWLELRHGRVLPRALHRARRPAGDL